MQMEQQRDIILACCTTTFKSHTLSPNHEVQQYYLYTKLCTLHNIHIFPMYVLYLVSTWPEAEQHFGSSFWLGKRLDMMTVVLPLGPVHPTGQDAVQRPSCLIYL